MEIKNIIVKEYLESLTEKDELNRIFPILLESLNFQILSKPTEYLGLQEYGKDIVAIGIDEDGIKKRFYFELKGGTDRNITDENFYGKDGIYDSLIQATYDKFISAYPKFEKLPLKIVIVHNGVIKGSVQSTLENFFIKQSNGADNKTYDRWDISKLTLLFSEHLFNPYLLVNKENTRLFNRILINLDSYEGVSPDFVELIQSVLSKGKWKPAKKSLSRQWKLAFETVKLLSFIIYTESKEYNNLDIAKRYLSQLILQFWHWILVHKAEHDKYVRSYFDIVLKFYCNVMEEYFKRVLPIAMMPNGIFSEEAGRYEQVGYTMRTFDVLNYFLLFIQMDKALNSTVDASQVRSLLVEVLNRNNVSSRPLLDIHSSPIASVLLMFVEHNDIASAKSYIRNISANLKWGKESYNRLPDANNSVENVIRLIVNQEKSVYYVDSTSLLIPVLLEFTAIFDLEEEYVELRDFVLKYKIDLGLFVPHHSRNSESKDLIQDTKHDLEEQLFSKSFYDGYQSELRLIDDQLNNAFQNIPLSFEEFKQKIAERITEFEYDYRTDACGYGFLRDLAHIFYKTPYFPDKWRTFLKPAQ